MTGSTAGISTIMAGQEGVNQNSTSSPNAELDAKINEEPVGSEDAAKLESVFGACLEDLYRWGINFYRGELIN